MGMNPILANMIGWIFALGVMYGILHKPLRAWWSRTRAESARHAESERHGNIIAFPGTRVQGAEALTTFDPDATTSPTSAGRGQGADLAQAKGDFLAGAVEIGLYFVLPIAGAIRAFILWPIAGPLALLNWFSIPLLVVLVPLVIVHVRHGRGAPFSHTAPRLLAHEIRGQWLKLTHAPEHHLRAHEARRSTVIQAGREAHSRDQEIKRAREFAALMQARLEAGRRQLADAMGEVLRYTTTSTMANPRQMKSAGTLKDAGEYGTKTVSTPHTRAKVCGRLLAPTLALYELEWVEPYNESVAKRWEHVASNAAGVLRYALGAVDPADVVWDESTAKLTVLLAHVEKVGAPPEPIPEEIEDEPQAETLDDETPLAVGRPPLSIIPTGTKPVGRRDTGITVGAEVVAALQKALQHSTPLATVTQEGATIVGPSTYVINVHPHDVAPSKVLTLDKDLAIHMGIPENDPQPRLRVADVKDCVAVELSRKSREEVSLREMLGSPEFRALASGKELPMPIGVNIYRRRVVADLATMPHLLAGGASGQGKSVALHSLIAGMVMSRTPDELRLLMADTKTELQAYNSLPHMLAPTAETPEEIAVVIQGLLQENARRKKTLKKAGVPNLETYNNLSGVTPMPRIVLVVDELADVMSSKVDGLAEGLENLSLTARSQGIHLILATQRPDRNVVSGQLKNNMLGRLALTVKGQVNSQIILDEPGADKLGGKGEALFSIPSLNRPVRVQTPLASPEAVSKIVGWWSQRYQTRYDRDLVMALIAVGAEIETPEMDGDTLAPARETPDTSLGGDHLFGISEVEDAGQERDDTRDEGQEDKPREANAPETDDDEDNGSWYDPD